MDYAALLDLCVGLGQRLQLSGAETFRVEESISRLLAAYGVKGDAYSIPNSIIVSLETDTHASLTRMCRVSAHGLNLDRMEQLSGLSRRLCAETPPMEEALALLEETDRTARHYRFPLYLLACMLASGFFALFFQGYFPDAVAAAISGAVAGACLWAMDSLHTNEFFKTILAAFISTVGSLFLARLGLFRNVDAAIIGPLTMLVPGFLFTNSMRDIIYGDTMSGVNRLVQVLIISVAIAVGSGFAVSLHHFLWGSIPADASPMYYSTLAQSVIAFAACISFCVLFNIHGPGMLLCGLGSALGWAVYRMGGYFGLGDGGAALVAALTISAYAEIMARVRKYPATSYLVISLFPLFPGASLYYALCGALRGEMDLFLEQTMYAAEVAGSIAIGVLLVSTVTRMLTVWRRKKQSRK